MNLYAYLRLEEMHVSNWKPVHNSIQQQKRVHEFPVESILQRAIFRVHPIFLSRPCQESRIILRCFKSHYVQTFGEEILLAQSFVISLTRVCSRRKKLWERKSSSLGATKEFANMENDRRMVAKGEWIVCLKMVCEEVARECNKMIRYSAHTFPFWKFSFTNCASWLKFHFHI